MSGARAAVGLILLFLGTEAAASCVEWTACMDVTGTVSSCSVVRVSDLRYLRVHMRDLKVEARDCSFGRGLDAREAAERLDHLSSRSIFYLEESARASCRLLSGHRVEMVQVDLCCDTLPPQGACALGGPLLYLKDRAQAP